MGIPKNQEELEDQLKTQIHFLTESSSAYDRGSIEEAQRLSLYIRILVEGSGSLLTHLHREGILFYDTSYEEEGNLVPGCGLLMTIVGSSSGKYVAPLDKGSPQRYSNGKIPLLQWWTGKKVFVDGKGNFLTRRDLVLTVCDKDGGAHVDAELPEVYSKFSRSNSLGWKFLRDGVEEDFSGRPHLESVRQISYEVLKSLKDEFPECFGR